jgi:hypothetical protein
MTQEQDFLKRAAIEIRILRNQNQLMSARLEMFDSIMAVLHTDVAQKSQSMSPDITWEIDKLLDNQSLKVSANP